jgi:hypothetical protein
VVIQRVSKCLSSPFSSSPTFIFGFSSSNYANEGSKEREHETWKKINCLIYLILFN